MEKKIDVIKAWKDSNYRNSLSQEQLNSIEMNPIGEPLENIGNLFGGANQPIKSSAGDGFKGCGWFGSISAECNGGNCCNPFYSWG